MLFYLAKIHNLLCFCFGFVVFYFAFCGSAAMCEPTSTFFRQPLRGVVVVQDVKERMSFASPPVRIWHNGFQRLQRYLLCFGDYFFRLKLHPQPSPEPGAALGAFCICQRTSSSSVSFII